MFALRPQSVRRSTPLARCLRAFFIFILIVSNLLLPPASVARAAPAETLRAPAPLQSSDPLPATNPLAMEAEQAASADAASAEANLHKPALPLHLALTLSRPVLTMGGNFERRVYNGLGQLVQVQKPQQDWRANVDGCNPGNNFPEVDVNYAYDALGRQTHVSTAVATTASWQNRAANWSSYIQTNYDALGRVTQVTAPNGELTYQWYVGRATSLEAVGRNGDSNKALKYQEVDGLGNLKRLVSQALINGNWQVEGELTLTHDVLGNLVRVVQAGGAGVTTLNYDLGGRKTSMSDPDLGVWSYVYDRQGRLTQQTDARQCRANLRYNALGRLVQKVGPACSTIGETQGYTVTYSYGNSGVNRGQLTQVRYSDSRYQKELSYNAAGLLASETVSIGGAPQSYTTQYGYDSYQRASTVSYPDGDVTTLEYNSVGLPGRLASSQSGTLVDGTSASGAVSNGVAYDEAGRLRTLRFPAGGNLWVSHQYYPWTSSNGNSNGRYWGMHVGTSNGAADRLATWYGYDSFGNVAGYAYTESGVTLDSVPFSYDAQNRLTSGYGKSYSYDSAGRLTNYEGTALTPASEHPHAMAPAGAGYGYDANGNLTARPSAGGVQTLTWDAENHLAGVSGGGVSESYVYDGDGVRVKKISGDQASFSVGGHYEVMRGGCSGETPAGATNWQAYGSTDIYLDVDTSSCGFSQTPVYVSALKGATSHWTATGGNAIYFPTASGFRVYIHLSNGGVITPAQANSWQWRISWSATPKGIQTAGLCSGQTSSGATNWQVYSSNAVFLDVDTSACGFGEAPLYFSSLGGHSGNWMTTGGDAIYAATPTGFRVYVRTSDGVAVTPAQANSYGWQINWVARPKNAKNSSYCSGQTPAGATNWQVYSSSGIYLDVNTTGCGLTSPPRYVTSIGGHSGHFEVTGATAIYFPTSTGFRVYVRYVNDAPITPAQANSYGWQINWQALPTTKNQVETKYYSFAGQRIAMKRDGVLTYLHSDHLGSTVLETNTSGQIVSDQRYYAYGKQRDTGPVSTDQRFTGQKQDASGLVYMNARYYDPVLGQFISPDTLVPDPGVLMDYNRYGYARGNPLRYTDKSGRTPWDVIDAGFWLWSANDFYDDPSWSNAGWLALDTLSLLPLAPSSGWVRRGGQLLLDLSGKTIGISADAAKLAGRIQNALPVGKALSEISQQSLETINKYDIKSFEDFARPRDPSGSPVHHLVEKRFYQQLGFGSKEEATKKILSIQLSTPEHIEISAALQSAIHPGRDTDIASVQRVWDAHKRVYREFGHEDWLDLVWEVYFQHLPDMAK